MGSSGVSITKAAIGHAIHVPEIVDGVDQTAEEINPVE
jgi:hypothetical protein